jgi:hypothetical protein
MKPSTQVELAMENLGTCVKIMREENKEQKRKIRELETTVAEMKTSRAGRLIAKDVPFMVVKSSEPYAPNVAYMIWKAEEAENKWTGEDEKGFAWMLGSNWRDRVDSAIKTKMAWMDWTDRDLDLAKQELVDDALQRAEDEGDIHDEMPDWEADSAQDIADAAMKKASDEDRRAKLTAEVAKASAVDAAALVKKQLAEDEGE